MYTFLIVLFVIASILMCLIVFFLEKTTWTLAAVMVVLSVVTAYVVKSTPQGNASTIEQKAVEERNQNPISAPAMQPSQSLPDQGAESQAPAGEETPAQ